ncbi:hypothetical protein NUSPORA_01978 [Nucleospora cyclopteri]
MRASLQKIKEKQQYLENKQKLKDCLENNKKIPHTIRDSAKTLLDDIIYNTEEEAVYPFPKVMVTTSHDCSTSLREFAKHMSVIFNGRFIPRAKMTEKEVSNFCSKNSITHLFIVSETKGNPTSIILCKYPHGKSYFFTIKNVKFNRRKNSMKERLYLILDGLESVLGQTLKKDLKLMVPMPENSSKKRIKNKHEDRVIAFINKGGILAFRHCINSNRKLKIDLSFNMKLYKIKSGTFDMDGDVEYQFNGYTNCVNHDVLSTNIQE